MLSYMIYWSRDIEMYEPVRDGHLVEEPLVGRRADTEMAAIMAFGCLTQDVSGRVPEDTLAWHRIISALQHRVM